MSDIIKEHMDKTNQSENKDKLKVKSANSITTLQMAGNDLREKYGNEILSLLAVYKIANKRQEKVSEWPFPGSPEIVPSNRIAYMIDSIKHPEEIALLRMTYGKMFFVVGVLCAEHTRIGRLTDNGMDKDEAQKIIQVDKRQEEQFGQQLDKALQFADFFIRNNEDTFKDLETQIKRFLDLIFNIETITPTVDEFAMHTAQSAALKSACLSRQVGAAITNDDGDIISTGYNDVPKAGGGLYRSEYGKKDHRCAYLSKQGCSNDVYKRELKKDLSEILAD
ncbi:MAG: hypothetical protein HQK94_19400 [Nitrospirae bacterium]|nr:hypothetical protein [Nitrospirota bacterium]